MSIPKICPLLAVGNPVHMAKCREGGCAWWSHLAGSCCVVQQQKAVRSATNTTDGKGGTDFDGTVATSTITENGGKVK